MFKNIFKTMFRIMSAAFLLPILFLPAVESAENGSEDLIRLEKKFSTPPGSARPWVYWFWKNGNISRDGITADLEAMEHVGIGGVIIMEVALSVPSGPIKFFSKKWRELFKHAVVVAHRLGLKITINSAPGWTGSGGPWITPDRSMKKVVASETSVSGPGQFSGVLPTPETVLGFYRDIAVIAFPKLKGNYRIRDIGEKALYERGPFSSMPGVRPSFTARSHYKKLPLGEEIPLSLMVDLTGKMDSSGLLSWKIPAGQWTILRFGYTSTGQTNRPAPLPGLECDKLDPDQLDFHFKQFAEKLLSDAGSMAAETLVATHMDSWEVGTQNWTEGFRGEFIKRRGYDPFFYMPVMTGRVVESLEISERFLWDLRETVSELIAGHGSRMHKLAEDHGLELSIEPYDMTPCDDMTLGATADVPMCEFWSDLFDTRYSVKEATSIGHVYGKRVIAAEAFTSGPQDAWNLHPAAIKSLGDWAFCEGVNRFVIHRYVHQPFPQIRPGLSLGPHGLHYERTETWWTLTRPWHEYLARCQYLLRQGTFIADILYLSPEGAPNVFQRPDPEPAGYKYDACTPEALKRLVTVKRGRLVLPDGMSYTMLVLPELETMTPGLLQRIKELVEEGAVIAGYPPEKSPSLMRYPDCDARVKKLAEILWGNGKPPGEIAGHRVGKGRVFWGGGLKRIPVKSKEINFSEVGASWIWYREGNPALSAPVGKRFFRRVFTLKKKDEIKSAVILMTADNAFKLFVNGRSAGEGGNFKRLYRIDVEDLLRPGVNVLAVEAENGSDRSNPAALIGALIIHYRDGKQLIISTDKKWKAVKDAVKNWATSLTPDDLTADGNKWLPAMELGGLGMAPWGMVSMGIVKQEIYPPSGKIVKLLGRLGVKQDFVGDRSLRFAHRRVGDIDIYFVSNGESKPVRSNCAFRVTGKQPELWNPETGRARKLFSYSTTGDGLTLVPLQFEPVESFFVVFRKKISAGKKKQASDGNINKAARGNFPVFKFLAKIKGAWQVTFDSRWGGPGSPVKFESLDDWSKRSEEGIHYYSGSAVYRKSFILDDKVKLGDKVNKNQHARYFLDLGEVHEYARVRLNGKEIGILWKVPFRADVSDTLKHGKNELEISVTNLWPNRMIGDERLAPDSNRTPGGTLREWPEWLLKGKASPTGRYTFSTWRFYNKNSPLLKSGLVGPVKLLETR